VAYTKKGNILQTNMIQIGKKGERTYVPKLLYA